MIEVVVEVGMIVHHGIKGHGCPGKPGEKAWVVDLQRAWVEDWVVLVKVLLSHQDVVM